MSAAAAPPPPRAESPVDRLSDTPSSERRALVDDVENGGSGDAQDRPEEVPAVPAAILHLVLEGSYLVLVTAAVVTPTPLREGALAGSQAGAAGNAEEASWLWLCPVIGGLLMGFAASAEVLGCCCTEPAQTKLGYVLTVLAAIALGAVDLADHVSSLRYCSANPTAAWCGGADVEQSDGAAAVTVAGDAAPPPDPVVEWLDHSSGDAVSARTISTTSPFPEFL